MNYQKKKSKRQKRKYDQKYKLRGFVFIFVAMVLLCGQLISIDASGATHRVTAHSTNGRFSSVTIDGTWSGACAWPANKKMPYKGTVANLNNAGSTVKKIIFLEGGKRNYYDLSYKQKYIIHHTVAQAIGHGEVGNRNYNKECTNLYKRARAASDSIIPQALDAYIATYPNGAQTSVVWRIAPEASVSIRINKEDTNPEYTEGNKCYSLAGAKYGVFLGDETTPVKELLTDASGVATGTVLMPPEKVGDIRIKEIYPSPGYVLDTQVYAEDGSSGSVTVTSMETPVEGHIGTFLYKKDSETGKVADAENSLETGESADAENSLETGESADAETVKEYLPQKGASLEGAVFEVNFYGVKEKDMPEGTDDDVITPLKTWYIQTNEKGYALLEEGYLAEEYDQSEFYRNSTTNEIILPLGVVTVKEVEASEGYLVNDELFSMSIVQEGTEVEINTYEEPTIPESVKRGDVEFIKAEEGSFHRMKNIPFKITALEEDGQETDSGESHIVVTDNNGIFSSQESYNAHSSKTNKNDQAWDGEAIDDSKLDSSAGIWFGDTDKISEDRGALPYGRYRIDELPCRGNSGYTLLEGIEFEISRNQYVVNIGTLINKRNGSSKPVYQKPVETGDAIPNYVIAAIPVMTLAVIIIVLILRRKLYCRK